jgi:hypothetical protein
MGIPHFLGSLRKALNSRKRFFHFVRTSNSLEKANVRPPA